jgi:hypothetical protein
MYAERGRFGFSAILIFFLFFSLAELSEKCPKSREKIDKNYY